MKITFILTSFILTSFIFLFFNYLFSQTVKNTYDNLGRLSKIEYSEGSTITYTYDNVGNWTSTKVQSPCDTLPKPVITPLGSTSFCIGDSIYLTSSPGVKYLWSNGDTLQIIKVKTGGIYTVTRLDTFQCDLTSLPVTLTTLSISVQDTSVLATPSSICPGSSSILTESGGILGDGANWNWYTGSCGGTYILSGVSVSQNPTTTTTYYVRAEGICNTTTCLSTTINVTTILPDSAGATTIGSYSACQGTSIITLPLNISNSPYIGSLSLEIDYDGTVLSFLQTGSTGQGLTNINDSLYFNGGDIVSGQTTVSGNTKMLRLSWFSNDGHVHNIDTCNSCNTGSGLLCDLSFRYFGGTTSLTFNNSVSGGHICEYTTEDIYHNQITCIDNPTNTFYVNGSITENFLSTSATSLTASPAAVCQGDSSTLSVVGGNLGTGANWNWYTCSCGGTFVASGSSPVFSPTVTNIYYVLATGVCNNTTCLSATIVVYTLPSQPSQITGNINPQFGDYEQYSIINDSNITNYSWIFPSGWSGTSTSNSVTYLVGVKSGIITVTTSNICGSGMIRTLYVSTGYTLNGYFTYDNIYNTPLDSVKAYLLQNGNKIDSTQADINGFYEFTHVVKGTYNLTATTHKPCGGINGTDALIVQRAFLAISLFTSSLRLHAADVNLIYAINSTSALAIQRYFIGLINSFPRGTWIFEKPYGGSTIDVSYYYNDTVVVNSNIIQNIHGICVGDVNCSYTPGTGKSEPKIAFAYNTVKKLNSNDYFEIPVKVTDNFTIGAISLIINFPKDLIEISDVKFSDNRYSNLYYNVESDKLRIIWIQDYNLALNLNRDSTLFIIKIKTKDNFTLNDIVQLEIDKNSLCELADENGSPIDNVVLKTYTIEHSTVQNSESTENALNNEMFIFPNPAENTVNIRYNIANYGVVKISMFNILGEKVIDIVNKPVLKGSYNTELNLTTIPPGVYSIKMVLDDNSTYVQSLIISR